MNVRVSSELTREIDSLIEEIRRGTEGMPSLTEQLLRGRKEEDVQSCGP